MPLLLASSIQENREAGGLFIMQRTQPPGLTIVMLGYPNIADDEILKIDGIGVVALSPFTTAELKPA
jgi:hypothetical protein